MSSFGRGPLKDLSVNQPATDNVQVAKVCLKKLDLRCLGAWHDDWANSQDRFGYGPERVKKRSLGYIPGTDWFWMMHVFSVANERWSLTAWLDEVLNAPVLNRVYTDSFVFDGQENYNTEDFYTVSVEQMTSLLAGTCTDPVGFFQAEGQLMRVMVSCTQHPARLAAYRAYVVLIGRFCGWNAVKRITKYIDKLENASLMAQCCNAALSGFLSGMRRYTSVMMVMDALWSKTFDAVEEMRDEYLWNWCFDSKICALHGFDCDLYLHPSQLVGGDTERNTPEVADEDEEEYCHVEWED